MYGLEATGVEKPVPLGSSIWRSSVGVRARWKKSRRKRILSDSDEKGSITVSRRTDPVSTLTWGFERNTEVMNCATMSPRDTVGKEPSAVVTATGWPSTSSEKEDSNSRFWVAS